MDHEFRGQLERDLHRRASSSFRAIAVRWLPLVLTVTTTIAFVMTWRSEGLDSYGNGFDVPWQRVVYLAALVVGAGVASLFAMTRLLQGPRSGRR